MTDSPRVNAPLDPSERPILEQLVQIRTRLELLKADKTRYVKSEDVMIIFHDLIAQVHSLNNIRTNKRNEQNRVDTVLDDCFQLISLAFLTIGKNSEAPALYSAVSTIKRLLDHLKEAAFFSGKDLVGIGHQLEAYRESIRRGKEAGCYDPHLLTLLEARLDVCDSTLAELKTILSHLTPDLEPTYEKLVSILRTLSAHNTRSKFPRDEVLDLQRQLKVIEKELHEKKCFSPDMTLEERYETMLQETASNPSPSAQKLVSDLLTRCLLWAEIVLARPGYVDESFRDTYDKLFNIRNQLESKSLLQAWSLRETDLYDYQRRLDRVDESRTPDGNFLNADGKPACLQTQRVSSLDPPLFISLAFNTMLTMRFPQTLLYLLRKSYALVYHLLTSSEPVSEALLPIYNQLKTLKKCLREVQKAGGVSSTRELWPYSMKLSSIDNMRVDGKFMVGNEIPDGQAAVVSLMEDCFELAFQLRSQAEENERSEEEGVDGKMEVDEAIEMKA